MHRLAAVLPEALGRHRGTVRVAMEAVVQLHALQGLVQRLPMGEVLRHLAWLSGEGMAATLHLDCVEGMQAVPGMAGGWDWGPAKGIGTRLQGQAHRAAGLHGLCAGCCTQYFQLIILECGTCCVLLVLVHRVLGKARIRSSLPGGGLGVSVLVALYSDRDMPRGRDRAGDQGFGGLLLKF